MPPRKMHCKKCRECIANCGCSCEACWDFRFKLGVKRIKHADGDPHALTTPLEPSKEDHERRDGSSRRAQAQAGLALLAQCQPTLAEWLRVCLAVRCLRMLELGQQGPAEGSVLDDDVPEDRARRSDHRAAASLRSGSRPHDLPSGAHLKADSMEEAWPNPNPNPRPRPRPNPNPNPSPNPNPTPSPNPSPNPNPNPNPDPYPIPNPNQVSVPHAVLETAAGLHRRM